MNSGVARLEQIMFILLTRNKHRFQFLLLRFVLHIINDERKLLTIFQGVLCEIQANQSKLLTFKNKKRMRCNNRNDLLPLASL